MEKPNTYAMKLVNIQADLGLLEKKDLLGDLSKAGTSC